MTTHGLSDFRPYYVLHFPHINSWKKKRTNHHDLIIDVYIESRCISIEISIKNYQRLFVFYTRELSYHKNSFTVIALLKTHSYYITPIINRYHDSETINKSYKIKCIQFKMLEILGIIKLIINQDNSNYVHTYLYLSVFKK